ncbi:uncharacterized protein MELLADRAFT_60695 [Melampsora larici-populina 98AG31]|uniref:Uncharacterized protein n=1 Tax=Melampsora larici-populina (strain 98AG31 / pathotype 3-4-7) TaxID=747676 RepID=F4RC00_MELLP|nr:uncharacterized protein MELLADRAFT_60695 [Melampsora larici-populina 98AG31]EGG10247.1 hypothetical protein MELLADRAFT_60695 [Melampsora larici-populina 98AG31]
MDARLGFQFVKLRSHKAYAKSNTKTLKTRSSPCDTKPQRLLEASTAMDNPNKQSKGSIKKQNRQVSKWIPDHNTPYCRSVTDFVKYLLGRTGLTPYPSGPTLVEISKLPRLTSSEIIEDTSIFQTHLDTEPITVSDIKLLPRQKASWSQYRQLFFHELANYGILRATLDWKEPPESPWNSIILACVAKHYNWGLNRGVFSLYPINPRHHGNVMCLGTLERWLRGHTDEITRARKNPHISSIQKKSARRSSVSSKTYHL